MIYQAIHSLHRIARSRSPYQYSTQGRSPGHPLSRILGGLLLVSLVGCAQPESPQTAPQSGSASVFTQTDSAAGTAIPFVVATPPTDQLREAAQQVQSRLVWLVPPADAITVTRFRLDNQCQDFVAEPIQVARSNPLADMVGRMLSEQDFLAFDLSGYRVAVDPTGTHVTIDLRLEPASARQLVSLSSCERLSLFGSLRKTLQESPDWRFQTVTFTLRGVPVVF